MHRHHSSREYLRDFLELDFYTRLIILAITFMLSVVFGIYNFVIGKRDVFTWVSISLTIGTAIAIILIVVFRKIKNERQKQQYFRSTCYKIYQKPYQKEYHLPNYIDQISAFESIYNKFKCPLYFDVVLENQSFDHSDISIDLILFHNSGIYAIQVLSFDGPIKGDISERTWTPYFYLGLKKTLKVDQDLYHHWIKSNHLSNPIMQTDLYVKNIQKYLPTYPIKGITILKETMIDETFDAMNERLFSLKDFISYVQNQPSIYTESDLKNAQNKLEKNIIKY